jgi:hypothetical protein
MSASSFLEAGSILPPNLAVTMKVVAATGRLCELQLDGYRLKYTFIEIVNFADCS